MCNTYYQMTINKRDIKIDKCFKTCLLRPGSRKNKVFKNYAVDRVCKTGVRGKKVGGKRKEVPALTLNVYEKKKYEKLVRS